MKCKDCEKYIKTSTSEHGVCSLLKDYFPTKAEDECVWINPFGSKKLFGHAWKKTEPINKKVAKKVVKRRWL